MILQKAFADLIMCLFESRRQGRDALPASVFDFFV